jgi:hypothetical protein
MVVQETELPLTTRDAVASTEDAASGGAPCNVRQSFVKFPASRVLLVTGKALPHAPYPKSVHQKNGAMPAGPRQLFSAS